MSLAIIVVLAVFAAFQSPAPQDPDAAARGKAVLDQIVAGNFAQVEEQFTTEMKAALPPGRLAAAWSGMVAQAGAFKSCGSDARVVAINDKKMVIRRCTFERAEVDIQFAFDTSGKISGLSIRPPAAAAVPYTLPTYANPSSYSESAVTIGSGEWVLPGTLTMPTGEARVPAVVLVHGSGPNDRDETIGGIKVFKDLALGLASRGIAVLRYDKRTKVHPEKLGTIKEFTVAHEVIDDVVEAVKALRTQRRVDASRIFVIGHSLGAMLVPRIAAADRNLAGFIVMAGPARSLEQAIEAQTRYIVSSDGTVTPEEQKAIDEAVALVATVRALQPSDAAGGRIISRAPASYWLDLRAYDPPTAAQSIQAPMLILQGERDYQVTMDDFARWKTALNSRKNVTFHSYPPLNHLFVAGTGPSLPAEYQAAGHVAEEVVRDITAWIHAYDGR